MGQSDLIIVSDSSSNLVSLEGVRFASVPLKIITSVREYPDIPATDVPEMVRDLSRYKGRSSTSCPNVRDWLEAFGDAQTILGVTITSGLSGSYESARQARAEYLTRHPDAKVWILDSLTAGPEMALLVEKMKECADAGLPFEEICRRVEEYRNHGTRLLYVLEHLDTLAHNGRVSPAVAKLAGIMGIRILGTASGQGTLEQLRKCRGASQSLRCACREMQSCGYAGGKVRLHHCINPQIASALADAIRADYPDADIRIQPCRALCSFYAEPGGLMIGFETGRPSREQPPFRKSPPYRRLP